MCISIHFGIYLNAKKSINDLVPDYILVSEELFSSNQPELELLRQEATDWDELTQNFVYIRTGFETFKLLSSFKQFPHLFKYPMTFSSFVPALCQLFTHTTHTNML